MDIIVDVDALRDCLLDYYGSAAFSGFPAAALHAWEVEAMDGYALCQRAESLGIDLRRFEAR